MVAVSNQNERRFGFDVHVQVWKMRPGRVFDMLFFSMELIQPKVFRGKNRGRLLNHWKQETYATSRHYHQVKLMKGHNWILRKFHKPQVVHVPQITSEWGLSQRTIKKLVPSPQLTPHFTNINKSLPDDNRVCSHVVFRTTDEGLFVRKCFISLNFPIKLNLNPRISQLN